MRRQAGSRWALLVSLALLAGCGFTVPQGVIWISPTNLFAEDHIDLTNLLGPNATCKIRHGGGRSAFELSYEVWENGKRIREAPLDTQELDGKGFTKRLTIRLEPIPAEAGRPGLEMLTVTTSEANVFLSSARVVIDDFGAAQEGLLTAVTDVRQRVEWSEDDVVPVIAIRRGKKVDDPGYVEGPHEAYDRTILVKARVTGSATADN